MAKQEQTTADKVWGGLSVAVLVIGIGLAAWSFSRGDHDWWLLGVVVLAVGWIGIGVIKFGYEASTAVEKAARGKGSEEEN